SQPGEGRDGARPHRRRAAAVRVPRRGQLHRRRLDGSGATLPDPVAGGVPVSVPWAIARRRRATPREVPAAPRMRLGGGDVPPPSRSRVYGGGGVAKAVDGLASINAQITRGIPVSPKRTAPTGRSVQEGELCERNEVERGRVVPDGDGAHEGNAEKGAPFAAGVRALRRGQP